MEHLAFIFIPPGWLNQEASKAGAKDPMRVAACVFPGWKAGDNVQALLTELKFRRPDLFYRQR